MYFENCQTFTIYTCNGYTAEASTRDVSDVAGLCALLEEQANDNYARVAGSDGQLCADSEGLWERSGLTAYERLEASGDAF